jgi:hypothetical protein
LFQRKLGQHEVSSFVGEIIMETLHEVENYPKESEISSGWLSISVIYSFVPLILWAKSS